VTATLAVPYKSTLTFTLHYIVLSCNVSDVHTCAFDTKEFCG